MAPVIRCALVIAGLTYYSPHRGAAELPGTVLDLGPPAAEALGVPLSRQELQLLQRAPGLALGVSESLKAISQGLGEEPSSGPQLNNPGTTTQRERSGPDGASAGGAPR